MLSRLIYASEPTDVFKAGQLPALLKQAREKNDLRHLTGLLVFDSRHFLQVLEGDRTVLSQLYARLLGDPRHRNVTLIGMDSIPERLFSRWSMGFAPADASHRQIYLRYGPSDRFEPLGLTAMAAVALLSAMASASAEAHE